MTISAQKPTIIVFSRSELLIKLIADIFSSNHEVLPARHSSSFFETLKSQTYKIVFIDLSSIETDLKSLTLRIKQQKTSENSTLILLSENSEETIDEALFDSILTSPFTKKKLSDAVLSLSPEKKTEKKVKTLLKTSRILSSSKKQKK